MENESDGDFKKKKKRATSRALCNLAKCSDKHWSSRIARQVGLERLIKWRRERFRKLTLTFDIPEAFEIKLYRERDQEAKQKRNRKLLLMSQC